jgi:WD40 repeat protein
LSGFFNNESHIITGSEDKKVYIYDTISGSVSKVLSGHSSVVHLVHYSQMFPLTIVSSSIDNVCILILFPF